MALTLRRRRGQASPKGVAGTARVDKRTKLLARRLRPGDVAIIDHAELDRVAAETLVEHAVAAVVNASPSMSDRYPNLGPMILQAADIPILDAVGAEVMEVVREGNALELRGSQLWRGEDLVAQGERLSTEGIRKTMDDTRAGISHTLEAFVENTLEYVRREQHILLDETELPSPRTSFQGRYSLVVTRGYHYKEDLQTLRAFIREERPVVVAVDGAADACLELGITPHVIVGDVDSVSTESLSCGAEIFVHPQGDWRRRHELGELQDDAPEVKMVAALGLDYQIVTAPGTSEDIALLLAHENGSDLIVTVGSRSTMTEFLDKGRKGMASSFLVRMRIGPSLIDAKGVSRLHRHVASTKEMLALVGAAAVTMGIISATAPPMRLFWQGVWDQVTQLVGL